jgi:Zn-dependent protease
MHSYSIRLVDGCPFVETENRTFRLPPDIDLADHERIERAVAKALERAPPPSHAWLMGIQLRLLHGRWADRVGAAVAVLIPRSAAAMVACTILAWIGSGAAYYFVTASDAARLAMLMASPLPHEVLWTALISFLLVVPVLIWHELGHLAYAHSRGVGPASVGVTTFVLLPAFYTKLRYLGTLARGEQAAFFCSGIYFQGLLSAALAGYMLVDPVAVADIFLINAAICGLNLLPVFKLDGYQAVSILMKERKRFMWLLNVASFGLTSAVLLAALLQLTGTTWSLVSTGAYRLDGGTGLLLLNALVFLSLAVFLLRRLKVTFDTTRIRYLRRRRLA